MNTTDPFRGISIFLEVVDAGSFTDAAERLDMSKSGVAKSISRLETTLGTRLFHRTTRSLTLTDEGTRFSEGCRRSLNELKQAQTQLLAQQQELSGRLRITLPMVLGKRWVLPELLEIAKQHPALELDINLTDRLVDLVEEGVDLAIRIGPLHDSATLIAKPLGVQRAVLCAAPEYLEKNGYPSSLEDLHSHACITFGSGGQARSWYFLDENGHSHSMAIRGRVGLNDSGAILVATLAGFGIALIADWLVNEHLAAGRLAVVLPNVKTVGFPIHAVWQRNQLLSPKVRHVVDLLADRFVPEQPWEVQGRN
ncbi:MAG: LysR family transcriptional regulator [Candidatus Pseudomonas phytovorans]|uniref:LysR family transcriptional regulator n=1 Tax=Candidatus Pseudomonas phytovorans TaxID=3121377 RepID=A0AAJ5WEU6_9PSED|nr:LysR family transcriptional regulator [Pseudomonas sp.]WEK28499.1 MAG: LysR family transcriptional regulator [Pseudomonas sp.]